MKPKFSLFFVALFLMIGLGTVSPLIFTNYKPGKVTQLPIIKTAPRFELTDSNAAKFSSESLRDKVWVFNFFFTSCDGPCPILSAHIKTIYDEFAQNPKLEFVSTSVDPKTDTPEVLGAYAEKLKVETSRWHFLVGEDSKIRRLAANGFNLAAATDHDHGMIHSNHLVLVDRRGKIRGYYRGTEKAEIVRLLNDIKKLLLT